MTDLAQSIEELRSTIPTLRSLLAPVDTETATWRPDPQTWSILDVVNHLADEERVDFRLRLDLTLHRPEEEWPGIDPERAITGSRYRNRSLGEALDDFIAERERSLAWLETLDKPDWNATYTHPTIGPITAGTLMASWVGHDLLHFRQIIRLRWNRLTSESAPHSLRYAGDW